MDFIQFERAYRALPGRASRRAVLARLTAVALAGLPVGLAGDEIAYAAKELAAEGKKRKKQKKRKKKKGTCPAGKERCGTACVDRDFDNDNCGACGVRCPVDEACCDRACLEVATDLDNCGACGNACASGEVCCDGGCRDLQTDPDLCGACDAACGIGQACIDGDCVTLQGTCPDGADFCAGDLDNCNGSNSNCACVQSLEGETRCVQISGVVTCGECTSSADCVAEGFGVGAVCLNGAAGCNCAPPKGFCRRACTF